MDPSDFGRYGSLALLKRNDPSTIVASYPIDDAEVTLGRDTSCSIRLYYPSVSAIHCKLVFNESTAFLVVLGANGVLVDGIEVFPAAAGAPPTTVPLPNGSMLDVHKKRFRFAYPPKHLRSVLLATPSPQKPSRRALRMSMIASAHVFTPRPSADPRENLRVLQSPLRPSRDDPEIVLVESNTPRVVEADKDLVILDEVTLPPPPPPPQIPAPVFTIPAPPQTPHNRPRNSLHRAVLIRSAHRAEMRREMWQEERDVEEVEEFITPVKEQDEDDEEMETEVETKTPSKPRPVSSWRKSLEAVAGWAFGRRSEEPDEEAGNEEDDDDDVVYNDENAVDEAEGEQEYDDENIMDDAEGEQEYDDENAMDDAEGYNGENAMDDAEGEPGYLDENENEDEEMHDGYPNENEVQETYSDEEEDQAGEHGQQTFEPPTTPQGPVRALGRFMTPQAAHVARPAGGRLSLGGFTGPRRVRVVEPWKIEDLVVPVKGIDTVKEEDEESPEKDNTKDIPRGWGTRLALGTPQRAAADKERLSDAERAAIRERRRSAVRMPDMFFNGYAPGTLSSTPRAPSPVKSATPGLADGDSEGSEQDTHLLLARMKEMVEGAKRRQSVGLTPQKRRDGSVSPRKKTEFSLLAPLDSDSEGEGEAEEQPQAPQMPPSDVRTPVRDRASADTYAEAEQTSRPAPAQVPHTPQYAGPRALFHAGGSNAQPMATPRMDGVKEMFLREARARQDKPEQGNVGSEEALEGLGEMLQTPAGWRPSPMAVHEEPEHDEQMQVDEDVPQVAPPRQPSPVEVEDSEPHMVQAVGTRVVRRGRTRTAEDTKASAGSSTGIPRSTRSLRSRTAEAADAVPEGSKSAPAKLAVASKRKVTESEGESAKSAPAAAVVRRTRRGMQSESEPEEVPAPAPRTLRRGRTKTPTPEPQPSTTRNKPSTTRRSAKSKQVEDAEGDDPLDAISHTEDPAPVPAPAAAARVRRTARSRIPVGSIKEEVEDSPLLHAPESSAAPRTRGSRTATTSTVETRTRTSARKAATPVADAGSTPASSIPEAQEGAGDKENTPEPSGEDEAVPILAKNTTRSKVARTGSKARQGTEEPPVGEEGPVAKAGKTRSGRTLGKTVGRK